MPACVSTTVARAARSWSASQVAGSNAVAIGQECGHRAHHLGRLVEPTQELLDVHPAGGLDGLPAAVYEDEAGAPLADVGRRPGSDDRSEPVTGEDDPVARLGEQARPLGDGEDVARERLRVVAVRRSVRQPMATQIHRHDVPHRAQSARNGRPRPRGVRQPMDEEHTGSSVASGAPLASPVEEMDPVAWVDDDHEAVGLGHGIRRWDGLHRP